MLEKSYLEEFARFKKEFEAKSLQDEKKLKQLFNNEAQIQSEKKKYLRL